MNAAAGRIGPNAITQCVAALTAALGPEGCAGVMQAAGLQGHLQSPPTKMVEEREVAALHDAMRSRLGVARTRALARAAGLSTGDYLLAHRIPRPARWLLPRLPAAMAAKLLLAAISRHAWTFCGSGRFGVEPAAGALPLRVSIAGGCISCRNVDGDEALGDYFAATFERLFVVLVHPQSHVHEVACAALGAPACVFEIAWTRETAPSGQQRVDGLAR